MRDGVGDQSDRSDFERGADDDQKVDFIFVLLHGSVEHFWKILSEKYNVRFHDGQRDVQAVWTVRNHLVKDVVSDGVTVHFVFTDETRRSSKGTVTLDDSLDSRHLLQCVDVLRVVS